jgi:hypothetical protein
MYAVTNGTMYCGLKFDTILLQYKSSNPAPDTGIPDSSVLEESIPKTQSSIILFLPYAS